MQKIFGKNVIREALKANRGFSMVYFENGFEKKEKTLFDMVVERKIDFKFVSSTELNQQFIGNNQGIGAIVDDYCYKELSAVIDDTKKQFFIVLDGLEDPQNLGAILRTADATRIDGIIIPKNHSVSLNATVAKVSVGAIEYVNLVQVNNLAQTMDYLKSHGFWIVGTDMNGEKNYTDIDAQSSLAIIIGSEGFGMSKLVRQKCDYFVSIPMIGHVNSLNASVTAALLMYEINRKR